MSKSAPGSGKPGLPVLVTDYPATGTFCPFKQPVTQDSIAAGVVLASILPLLETYGQSLAEPQSPFPERKCPMRKCDKKFKTPWSFINHLLLCSETSSGDVSCQKCQPSHVEKPAMSPVRQVLRRLSAGARKRNHHGASSLDFPDAKRGRIEDGLESLPMGESDDLLNMSIDFLADPQEYSPEGLAELDSMVANYDRLFPGNPEQEVSRRPLQQSWHDQPPAELAAGSAPPRHTAAVAELYGTPQPSSASLFSRAPLLRTPAENPPTYPWSAQDLTVSSFSPTETQVQKQTPAILRQDGTSSHYVQQVQNPSFGMEPQRLKYASGYSLAPTLDGRNSFHKGPSGSGGSDPWFTGTGYSQYGQLNLASETANPGAMGRPAGTITGPSTAGLSVVTQTTPIHQHAYGQQNGVRTPTNRLLVTPVSTTSGPSATSTHSSSWGLLSSISSASTGHTSINITSPTNSSTKISCEPSGSFRSTFPFPGRPVKANLVIPEIEATAVATEHSSSPGAESVGQCEVCPICGYKPKRKKNHNAHLERHLKTHQPGQGLPCEFPGCDRIIAGGRTDNLRQHMIKAHSQLDISAVRNNHLTVSNMTPTSTPQSASIGDEEARWRSWTGQYGDDGRGSRRGSAMLTGLVSGNETQFDSQQTLGGLESVEEGKDDLDTGVTARDRPSDMGPTAWNDNWI